jgi:hypothetical protein
VTEVICPHGRRLNVFSGVPPEVTTPVTSCFSQYDTFGDPDCQILAVAVTSIFASNRPLQTACQMPRIPVRNVCICSSCASRNFYGKCGADTLVRRR